MRVFLVLNIASSRTEIYCAIQNCDPGTYSALSGAVECYACKPGTASDQPGQQNCTDCAKGTYADKPKMTTCLPCLEGSKRIHHENKTTL